MADSVAMIDAMVAYLDTLPKTASGDVKVEDPTATAVEFVGIVAPIYGAEIDSLTIEKDTYQNLARQHENELISLRAEVDNLRESVSAAIAHLNQAHVAEALAALGIV